MDDQREGPARSDRRTGNRQYVVARVALWGTQVGAVAEDALGNIVFEYTEEFRNSGLELSPIHLPLSRRGPVSFPELSRLASFAGLPGVLADCLPDAFGNTLIQRYFEQKGTPNAALSPVQKLLYIGSRAMGALEFSPPIDGAASRAGDEALEIARLVDEARLVIEGDLAVAVPEIMQVGASAGGARAKALILLNRETGKVKSAFARAEPGDEHWMIKFDGVTAALGGHTTVKEFTPGPWGRIEQVYAQMARAAGITMEETRLLREREFGHFMTRRFDREKGARLHMHSLGGLHHADYNIRQVLSYEDYFRTIRLLGLGQPEVDEAFRRMVFNFAARNQDDHVKNLAFLMGPDGQWRLAPAFDMTWAYGGQWTRTHQMTARGKDDDFTRADLVAVARVFDVARDGAEIIEAVESALQLWRPNAGDAGLDSEWIGRIEGLFRHFA
jgi:serine/threonine-protein kinase HipA